MPKYRVGGQCTITVFTDVVADSPEQAIALSNDRSMVNLCHQCAGGDADEEWCTGGELDGTPEKLEAEEIDE